MPADTSSILPLRPSPDPVTTPLTPPVSAPRNLPEIPGYAVLHVLGRGGMGVVYKAHDTRLHRDVAVKMMTAGSFADVPELQRFRGEAEAIAALQHPNIVQIHEVGEVNGLPYFVMEYVDGGSLVQEINGRPVPPKWAADVARQIARGLAHSHERGIIHRDIKPANILLQKGTGDSGLGAGAKKIRTASWGQEKRLDQFRTPGDFFPNPQSQAPSPLTPKVSDFGLAKRLDGSGGLTQTGTAVGTPNYMAPEQASGRRDAVTPAVDVYATGAVLYEMLVGRPPFLGSDPVDILFLVRSAEPVPPSRLCPGTPRDLETICLKCLEKSPARRYATAAELADDLDRYLAGEPIRARPVGPLERAWKWARRRPTIAAMSLSLILVFLTGLGGVLWQWHRAAVNFQLSQARLYNSRIAQAVLLWDRNSAVRAADLLQRAAAEADAPPAWEWHYLAQQTRAQLAVTMTGDAGTRIAVSPDGQSVVAFGSIDQRQLQPEHRLGHWLTTSAGGRLLATGRKLGELAAAELRSDGRVVTLALNGEVRVWDQTGREVAHLSPPTAEKLDPRTPARTALSPHGEWLARCRDDHSIELCDPANPSVVKRFTGHTAAPTQLVFAGRGAHLLSRGSDRTVRLWDISAGRETYRWDDANGFDVSAVSDDGRTVAAVVASESAVRVRDRVTGREIARLTMSSPVEEHNRILLSPSGRYLAHFTGQTVQTWEVPSGRGGAQLVGHRGSISTLAFGPDGCTLATGGEDGEIRLWDLATGQCVRIYRGHGSAVRGLAFAPDGQRLFSSGHAGELFTWDATRDPAVNFIPHVQSPEWMSDLRFDPGGTEVRVVGTRLAAGYDAATGRPVFRRPLGLLDRVRYPRSDSALTPDGRAVLGVTTDEPATLLRIELDDGRVSARYTGSDHPVQVVAVSECGRWVAASGSKWDKGKLVGLTAVWDAGGGEPLARLAEMTNALAIAPDGRLALAPIDPARLVDRQQSAQKPIVVFDPKRGTVAELPTPEPITFCLALNFSPDGRDLAGAFINRSPDNVAVWDVAARKLKFVVPSGTAPCRVAFSPDGRRFAVNGYHARVSLWDAATGDEVMTLPQLVQRRGDYGYTAAVRFSPDGRRLAALAPGGIYVFDAGPVGESETATRARLLGEMEQARPVRAAAAAIDRLHDPFARGHYLARLGDRDAWPPVQQYDNYRLAMSCGDWPAAYAALVRAKPAGWCDGFDWPTAAVLTRLVQGEAAYRQFCGELPERLPNVSRRVSLKNEIRCRAAAPEPANHDRLRQLLKAAESERPPFQPGAEATAIDLALAEHRLGASGPWTAALDRELRLKSPNEMALGSLVMAVIRRGEGSAAESAFWKARFDNWLSQRPEATRREGVSPWQISDSYFNPDWALMQLLYRELTGAEIPRDAAAKDGTP